MAWTQTDLDAIEEAIASGERTVAFTDKTVTYRSIQELLRARDLIKSEIDAATATEPRATQTRFVTKSGWS